MIKYYKVHFVQYFIVKFGLFGKKYQFRVKKYRKLFFPKKHLSLHLNSGAGNREYSIEASVEGKNYLI